ncbi:GNAT family protein [Nonomuraea sp. B12E4]|uniref:GNAT family protein n=1 Tax=Nonomuraea sp. B12E4 TaxID=3153564 RepID=UPI00325D16B1
MSVDLPPAGPVGWEACERNGFVREGVLRPSARVMGGFLDEVLLGLLVQDWKPDSKGQAAARLGKGGRGAPHGRAVGQDGSLRLDGQQ